MYSEGLSVDKRVVAYLALVVRAVDAQRLQAMLDKVRRSLLYGRILAGVSSCTFLCCSAWLPVACTQAAAACATAPAPLLSTLLQDAPAPASSPRQDNIPKSLPLAVPLSHDGMFFLERMKPIIADFGKLGHRLPFMIPLAGVCLSIGLQLRSQPPRFSR